MKLNQSTNNEIKRDNNRLLAMATKNVMTKFLVREMHMDMEDIRSLQITKIFQGNNENTNILYLQ